MALKQPETLLHVQTAPPPFHPRVLPSHTLSADYAVCREVMRGASRNYSFAARFLPADKLPHVEALYALMRVGDDIVDVQYRGTAARAAIEQFEELYWRAFDTGSSSHPVLRAYLHTAHQFHLSPELMRPYFRAMSEDLSISRFPTFADLLHYMDGSALPVGRAMAHILGAKTRHVRDVYKQADALSIAMQLSNFWRDVAQDWSRGRVYLPQEDLVRFGVTEDDIAAGRITPNWIALMEFEFERTEGYYRQAREGVRRLASGRWAVMSALEIYHAILTDIRSRGFNVFAGRAGASKWEKLRLVASAWRQVR
ncbi:MAG: phytoene/squalene synthase family protein [Chloroflexi bacterium]|nr:phytoene/squalene synthase family protein [Chloroflexota bacterium]